MEFKEGFPMEKIFIFELLSNQCQRLEKNKNTVNLKGQNVKLEATGRHDPRVLPRAVPIVEAMAALTIMDHYLRNKAQNL